MSTQNPSSSSSSSSSSSTSSDEYLPQAFAETAEQTSPLQEALQALSPYQSNTASLSQADVTTPLPTAFNLDLHPVMTNTASEAMESGGFLTLSPTMHSQTGLPSSNPSSRATSPSLAPSNDFLLDHGHLAITNRAPPSSPPTGFSNPGAYSMPTVFHMSHPSASATLVASYRRERRTSPLLFDAATASIRARLTEAKHARGGVGNVLRHEYTVELASREDAARLERLHNREGLDGGRSRANSISTEIEMLPPAALDDEETRVEELLRGLLGEEGLAELKGRVGVESFAGAEEAAKLLREAREGGKFAVKLE